MQFFEKLALDCWYKVVIYAGFIGFIASLYNGSKPLLRLCLGMFLAGVGEWMNYTKHSQIKPPNAYTGRAALLTCTVRKNRPIGILFDLVGTALILWGGYKLIF